METLTINDKFSQGAFLHNVRRKAYSPILNSNPVFLTQEGNTSLKDEIIKLILHAKNVLKICSFIITDKEIFETLLQVVKEGNVVVFLLTQLDQSKLNVDLIDILTEEEIREDSSNMHLEYIQQLYHEGVHVRASVSAHAKFIIVDRNIGFITSANMTQPSLELNTESGVYLNELDSKELDRLFDVIFQTGTHYRKFIDIRRYNKMMVVHSRIYFTGKLLPNPQKSNLRYTFEQETNNLYEEIVHIINNAMDYLYLSTYSIVEVAKIEELYIALKNACNRGVKVIIFCRGMNYRNDHLEGCQRFSDIGCHIYADMYNHSKGIINETKGMLFTANIDGRHGLKNGFEVGIILDEVQRIAFLNIHEELIKMAHYHFQKEVVRGELFRTFEEYERIKRINRPDMPSELIISPDPQVEVEALSSQILFYGRSGSEEYLIAGNSFYKCNLYNRTFYVNEQVAPRNDLERYVLTYVNLTIKSNL
jgi:phosphatidylserine/phosphatidylglycerophosphate/cardiolipin synthase-like enzyme